MPKNVTWDKYTNILCVRPDGMGDVLMTTPAFRALKASFPRCKLTLLTSSAGAAIGRYIPEIDDIIAFDVPWVKNGQSHDARAITAMADELKKRAFDGAILFTTYSQNPLPSAMLCYLAGIPDVLGYCRENPYNLINYWVPDPEPLEYIRHEVTRQLDLVESIGARSPLNSGLSLKLPSHAEEAAIQKLASAGVELERPWLILHAAASEAKRCYDPDGFIAAGRQLADSGWQIVLTGSKGEATYISDIAAGIGEGAISATGKLSLEELCGATASASVLISNNTGPVHIAAALGTPVVVLYARTNPQHIPWKVPSRVLYFPVRKELRSRNRLLQTFAGPTALNASPKRIVEAVKALAKQGKVPIRYA